MLGRLDIHNLADIQHLLLLLLSSTLVGQKQIHVGFQFEQQKR
jgi:hypothetical protein